MTKIHVPTPLPQGPAPEADPFRYGWRYVRREQPDGTVTWDEVPLTLEDVLHPREGDVIVQNTVHDDDWFYLGTVIKARCAVIPGAKVFRDVGINWDVPGLRHHSPDITVVFGVRSGRERWSTFDVAEEGVRPTLIIEVVSPNTRAVDVETKVDHYHRARVPFYVIVDREREEGPPRLIGYRYAPAGWVELAPDGQGRLSLDPVGLLLGTRGNRVVLYDAQTGEELGDYLQVTQARQAAEARAQTAEARAQEEAAARRAAEDAARAEALARQAAEARAQEEAARALASQEQARAEAAARADLERRLRELEAQLRQRPDTAPDSGPQP
jgi:Uma2 family endonuclease